jgi:hypothetical protein
MHDPGTIRYGLHSPFDDTERRTIEDVHHRVRASAHPSAALLAGQIQKQITCLETLGEVLATYPSPRSSQTLGSRERGLQTLVEKLCAANPANFEFLLPTRAIVGRALVMAEGNFYRFLAHVCAEALTGAERERFRAAAIERMHACLYTKLVEEVLSGIACDQDLKHEVRSRAVAALAQIWDRRLTYRVRDFFPILEATWNARQKITAVGGTLSGTQEMFALFQAGCDPGFVDFFARPDPSSDEIEAFREFLFGATTEELDRASRNMAEAGINSVDITDRAVTGGVDAVTVFYSFFRARYMRAVTRRLGKLPGPKRTAEEYLMISYLLKHL